MQTTTFKLSMFCEFGGGGTVMWVGAVSWYMVKTFTQTILEQKSVPQSTPIAFAQTITTFKLSVFCEFGGWGVGGGTFMVHG